MIKKKNEKNSVCAFKQIKVELREEVRDVQQSEGGEVKATRGLLRDGKLYARKSRVVVVVGCVRKINFALQLPRERQTERKGERERAG